MPRYPQAILVSCEIPWDEEGNLLEDIFRREIRYTLSQFRHLYIFGTAGEGYAIDTARFQQIGGIFYEETRGEGVHPMVGIIALSTANTIERIGLARDIGFRTFQIVLPSWGVPNNAEVLAYFQDVCGTFPDCQFLHYNLPRAKRVLEGPDYRRLADAVPNLVATKNTGGGLPRAAGLLRHAPDLQHFLGETNFPHGCFYGECSLLASFGLMTPHKTRALFEGGRARDAEALFRLQHGFHNLLSDVLGPLLDGGFIDGAFDKALVRLGGFEEMPLRLLSPYQGLSEEQYQACKRRLHQQYSDWVAST